MASFRQLPDSSQSFPNHLTDTFKTHSRHLKETFLSTSWMPSEYLRGNLEALSRNFTDTLRTPSRHLTDNFKTPSSHLTNTFQTLSEHLMDTFKTTSIPLKAAVNKFQVTHCVVVGLVGGWVVYRYIIMPLCGPTFKKGLASIQVKLSSKLGLSKAMIIYRVE